MENMNYGETEVLDENYMSDANAQYMEQQYTEQQYTNPQYINPQFANPQNNVPRSIVPMYQHPTNRGLAKMILLSLHYLI